MTKQERSKAAAEKRTNAALRALGRVGDLSGRGYELGQAAVQKMFDRLKADVEKQRGRFTEQSEFSFDDDDGGRNAS